MRRRMLLVFVEEMGHEYEALLDRLTAIEEDESKRKDRLDPAAVLATVGRLCRSSWNKEKGFVEDESR